MQSALHPHGPVAEAIAATWWVMLWGALAVLALVMASLFYAMFRAPERRLRIHSPAFIAIGGIAFPTVVLTALLIYGTAVGRMIVAPATDPLHIEVVGHQWWWEVRYHGDDGLPPVVTANEVHVPVGVPVEFSLRSADVIHSFWVPALGGKVDLVPGRTNTHRLEASRPGVYRGQCAEFCGAQHARMGLLVIARPADEFAEWRRRRAAGAAVTTGAGYEAFIGAGCGACHTVRGTDAAGRSGPDLTHVGAQHALGAATIANDAGGMRRWVARHGGDLKPGNHGPDRAELDEATAEAIAAYLERLQ